ncbi:MAG: CDP-alcohol phosphatidyltransferase family protein [Solirubrobacteraceae bacterium]
MSPIGKRRLLGIDRSGPPPEATQAGAPLHPWTLPNAIGYARLAGIPVFLIVALSSDHGQSVLAATLYAVIGWSDYLDGFVARLTGQYSRMGALLDPVVDRLLILSGVAVVWRFDLLPKWALALVIAREVFVLALSRYGLRRGVDLRINWFGRVGVAPTMGAPFFAMLGLHTVALIMLYLGLALALLATVMYVRTGLAEIDRHKVSS